MKAPQKAKQIHAQKKAEGSLTEGVVVPFRSAAEKAQKFLQWKQHFPQKAERVRVARARLAAEALPISGSYHTPETDVSQPTPQRKAKNSRAPLQPYSGKWPPEVEIAFAKYLVEAEHLQSYSQRVTISYDGGGGGSNPSQRAGGLGHVPEKIRELHSRHQWIRRQLSLKAVLVLDKMVIGMPNERDGNLMTLQQMGNYLFPAIRDMAMSRGVTLGALLMIGEQLDDLYGYYEREFGGRR